MNVYIYISTVYIHIYNID